MDENTLLATIGQLYVEYNKALKFIDSLQQTLQRKDEEINTLTENLRRFGEHAGPQIQG